MFPKKVKKAAQKWIYFNLTYVPAKKFQHNKPNRPHFTSSISPVNCERLVYELPLRRKRQISPNTISLSFPWNGIIISYSILLKCSCLEEKNNGVRWKLAYENKEYITKYTWQIPNVRLQTTRQMNVFFPAWSAYLPKYLVWTHSTPEH